MIKFTFLLSVTFLFTACSTSIPQNVSVKITGIAPQEGECELQLVKMSKNENDCWRRPVIGPFEEIFLLSHKHTEYIIEGGCDDEVTYMNVFVFPASSPLNIGALKP